MTTEDKVLTIANTLFDPIYHETLGQLSHEELMVTLVHAVEQHEAFKQKVSDAAQEATEIIDYWSGDRAGAKCLQDFIMPKPKPDPLVKVLEKMGWYNAPNAPKDVENFRAALDAAGFEIREKNDD